MQKAKTFIILLGIFSILISSATLTIAAPPEKPDKPPQDWETKCDPADGMMWTAICELRDRVVVLEDKTTDLINRVTDLETWKTEIISWKASVIEWQAGIEMTLMIKNKEDQQKLYQLNFQAVVLKVLNSHLYIKQNYP